MSLAGFKSSNHPQQVAKRGATDRDNLGTDPALFRALDERFGFTLDVAATTENAKCADYFTKADNGLEREWSGRVWCNPPYSQIRQWIEKAWGEWACDDCDLIVMLLPANRTEQAWWQDLVEPYRLDRTLRVEFIRGRQRFVLPGAEAIGPNERPPFGCCLLIWDCAERDGSAQPPHSDSAQCDIDDFDDCPDDVARAVWPESSDAR